MMKSKRYHKTHKPAGLGKLLNSIPTRTPVLYPLYLARQIYRQEHQFVLPGLPDAFDGFRAVFLSDLHFGAYLDEERLKEIVKRVNAEDADAVFLGGDYGDDPSSSLMMWSVTEDFRAKEGVYAVLGNHDIDGAETAEPLCDAVADRGVTVLVNDTAFILRNGERLAVSGLDECYFGSPDWEVIEKESSPARAKIVLAHSPDVLPDYFKRVKEGESAFFGLFLCGHTHGGQIALGGRAIRSSSLYGNRYNMGHYMEKGADILVSPGLGTSFLPLRFGAKPAYHVITLKKK